MKFTTPKSISLFTSLLLATIVTTFFSLSNLLLDKFDLLQSFLIFVITVLFGRIVLSIVLRKFIYDKVKVVYKTILSQKGSSDNIIPDLEKVNNDVYEALTNRQTEFEELKKMESFRREFVGNVSHELKTPIFNMQGFIYTLLDGAIYDEEVNIKYLKRAAKSIDRMISIVDDLDVISKIEANQHSIELTDWDIVALLEEIIEQLEMKSKQKNITIEIKESFISSSVFADRDHIHHVVTNLLVNSIKYGKEGGVTEVRLFHMGDNFLIEIADNGIGIAQEHLSRLFERFYRVDKSRSRGQGGTGLGLSIVKHIIESHGQTINVRSTEGVGTTFGFTLAKSKLN